LVEGKIQLDEVEKDGVKRLFVSVISDNVELIGNKSESPAGSNGLEESKDLPF
jgi:single-stranded DNA-binding protein